MDYKVYENVFDDDFINYILNNLDESRYRDGRVGAGGRVNLNQKNRKDLFIQETALLSKIDDKIYSNLYKEIKENFSDIKYRERWKAGKYIGEANGFYNVHRDDSDETAFRSTSMIIALSDPDDYEGGELCFDSFDFSTKLKKGSVVVFKSSIFHHVNPVTSGTRVVLISFFFDETGKEIKNKITGLRDFTPYKPILSSMSLEYDDYIDESRVESVMTKIVGDVDYSDNGSKHAWSDKDDYLYEDNGGDVLLVTFAGMGWKQSIPTFIFYNFLKQYTNIDKLFLRDINCRYYMSGLKNSTMSLEETVSLIKEKIAHKKYKKIIGLGCSAGGFAAILYGELLKFDKVLAFAPQTVINKKKDELIGDKYNAPNTCRWLRDKKPDDEMYQKSLDLINYRPFHSSIDIHYSINGNNGIDKKHALYLEDSKCKIIEHPGNDHMIALSLRNNGKLKEIIEKEIFLESNIESNIELEISAM